MANASLNSAQRALSLYIPFDLEKEQPALGLAIRVSGIFPTTSGGRQHPEILETGKFPVIIGAFTLRRCAAKSRMRHSTIKSQISITGGSLLARSRKPRWSLGLY
jgi:hypothetical protein